jgi:hypothetical protein
MPKKIKDVAVKTGTYKDRNGEEKGRWLNVGSVLQLDDGGKVLLLNRSFNPAGVPFKEGSDVVMLSMFDPKDKDGKPIAAAPVKAAVPEVIDSDIPF